MYNDLRTRRDLEKRLLNRLGGGGSSSGAGSTGSTTSGARQNSGNGGRRLKDDHSAEDLKDRRLERLVVDVEKVDRVRVHTESTVERKSGRDLLASALKVVGTLDLGNKELLALLERLGERVLLERLAQDLVDLVLEVGLVGLGGDLLGLLVLFGRTTQLLAEVRRVAALVVKVDQVADWLLVVLVIFRKDLGSTQK